ncbi:hypothetical protein B0H16DRAFT_1490606 [Mycena metata]|uniref:PB1 domain-containing protein n=1 Tax=Mycena metata TaxID=1033252 RepID=A0AAD7P3B4_9AGAR|nr:hypothetical protein B0H16DRAFT_1490606 [Mycena metata]
MATTFKLTRDNLTRRVTFPAQPTWATLSAKIHELFAIPVDKVGVSYIDADSDEVTASSEDELRDYFATYTPGQAVRFVVQDLTRNEKALPDTPRSTAFRNTFGVDNEGLPFDIEDDWQRLPPLGTIFPVTERSESPHAFIQVVESDASSSIHRDDLDDSDDEESDGDSTTDFGRTLDKGKARAVDPSPAPSVVAESLSTLEAPPRSFTPLPESVVPDSPHSTVIPVTDPAVETQAVPQQSEAATAEDPSDPPLPTLDSAPAPQASLTTDVATLLTTLTNVVSAHPELSEGLRNIVQNATNGIYWNSHRASVAQAAGEFVQSAGNEAAEARRRAEEEAGRRVAEALGGMFRTFSSVLGGGEAPSEANPASAEEPLRTSTPTEQVNSTSFWYGGGQGTRDGRRRSWGSHWAPGPFHHGPPGHHGPHHGPHGLPHGPLGGPFAPPHLSGRGRRGMGFPPLPHWAPPPPHWGPGAPPPPPPPPSGPPPHPSGPPPPPPPPAAPAPAAEERPKPTPQELRAQVEAAKLLYKAEKERYRAEREERRRAREVRIASDPVQPLVDTTTPEKAADPSAPPPVTHLVSAGNPKVGYPQLEMYSVPHRSNTFHGHPSRRHGQEVVVETPAERTMHRITKRLAAVRSFPRSPFHPFTH